MHNSTNTVCAYFQEIVLTLNVTVGSPVRALLTRIIPVAASMLNRLFPAELANSV